jgi:hypothetical protein
MAAANESQGLKIAVAAFVSLTVILAVTSYFLYSNYDQTAAKLAAETDKANKAAKAQSDILNQYTELVKRIGSKGEEYDAVKNEMAEEQKKLDATIQSIAPAVAESIGKVQAAGGASPALEEVKTNAQNLAVAYGSEPNKSYISSLSRVVEMLKNQARVTAVLAANYTDLKRSLEAANSVNKQQMDVVLKERDDAKADVESEQTKHEQARGDILARLDEYQTDINNKATEIATLTSQSRQFREETTKKLGDLNNVIRELRDEKAQKETVLDQPDGYITYVDYRRGEVRTNINYGMGARPQMSLTIFDSGSPGIPTERPKGTIELIWVGERYSIARITETKSDIEPIRVGDIVYSPAWSPNEPMRFALIGKMDVNRDGKDDRADLIRMIEAAGGVVDYDLPPPSAGKERGKITGRDAWYVIDDPEKRPPLREFQDRGEALGTAENVEFLKKQSEAIREARDNGVRPMLIGRLLSYHGYNFHAPVVGRAEAVDRNTLKNLVRPRPDAAQKAAEENPEPSDSNEEMPREEQK